MPTIDLDGVSLYYTDEGMGEPVVLIHGFPLSLEMWTPQRAALSADYRVIALDLRGSGRSDPPHHELSIGAYADDAVALMDALGIGQATVGGLSMGGYVLMALLRRHPERVSGVILMATKATADTASGKQGRDDMIALARSDGAAAIAEKMLPRMLTSRTRSEDPGLVDFVRSMMASTSVEGIVGALGAMRDRPDSTSTLEGVLVPSLVIGGGADEIAPPAETEAMQRAIPGAEFALIPDAAHLLNLEQPEATNRAILDFMGRTVQR